MSHRGMLGLMPRTKRGLVVFFAALFMLSIALQYAAAMAPKSALALSGAVYSRNFDGTIINKNHYDTKPDVYLTGGPCQGGSHLDAGDYYFSQHLNTATCCRPIRSATASSRRRQRVHHEHERTHGTHAVACPA